MSAPQYPADFYRLVRGCPHHPKFDDLEEILDHPGAFRMWARLLDWPSEGGPDGQSYDGTLRATPAKIARHARWKGDPVAFVAALVRCELLDEIEDAESGETYWRLHDFKAHNPHVAQTMARISDLSKKRAEAGKKGAESRWGADGKNPRGLGRKWQSYGKRMANAGLAIRNHGKRCGCQKTDGKRWQRMAPCPCPCPCPGFAF